MYVVEFLAKFHSGLIETCKKCKSVTVLFNANLPLKVKIGCVSETSTRFVKIAIFLPISAQRSLH